MSATNNASIIDEARQINSSLRRVGQNVRVSVALASSAAEILDQDGTTISSTLHEHKYELKQALDATDKKLTRIKYAEAYEKLVLKLSVTFFTAVVFYIIAKRLGILSTAWYLLLCKWRSFTS
jgi:phage-related holin